MRRSLRILYVSTIDLSTRSGANEHVVGIASGLAAAGNRVHLVTRHSGDPPRLTSALHHHSVEHTPPRMPGTRGLAAIRAVAAEALRVAGETRPDAVYLRTFPLDHPFLARQLERRRVPYVAEINTTMGSEYRAHGKGVRGRLYDRLQRGTLSGAEGWVVMTRELQRYAEGLSGVNRPTLVGKNGFDPTRVIASEPRVAVRRRLGVGDDDRVLVMAGFSRPWHGADRAVAMLSELPTSTLLWLVGGTGEDHERSLRDLAARLGVDERVSFFPWHEGRDLATLLAAADVGLGPMALDRKGMSEAQALKTATYLALGLPVLVNHEDPRLDARLPFVGRVDSSDPAVLAGEASKLVDLPEPDRRRAATFAIEALTWASAAAETEAFLRALSAGRDRP